MRQAVGLAKSVGLAAALLVAAILGVRGWQALRDPALATWHRYAPKEASAEAIAAMDWAGWLVAEDAVFDAVTAALKSGDSVSLLGIGAFQVKSRAARAGRNPRTGETIEIAASKAPVFKAGKALKDAVN